MTSAPASTPETATCVLLVTMGPCTIGASGAAGHDLRRHSRSGSGGPRARTDLPPDYATAVGRSTSRNAVNVVSAPPRGGGALSCPPCLLPPLARSAAPSRLTTSPNSPSLWAAPVFDPSGIDADPCLGWSGRLHTRRGLGRGRGRPGQGRPSGRAGAGRAGAGGRARAHGPPTGAGAGAGRPRRPGAAEQAGRGRGGRPGRAGARAARARAGGAGGRGRGRGGRAARRRGRTGEGRGPRGRGGARGAARTGSIGNRSSAWRRLLDGHRRGRGVVGPVRIRRACQ